MLRFRRCNELPAISWCVSILRTMCALDHEAMSSNDLIKGRAASRLNDGLGTRTL